LLTVCAGWRGKFLAETIVFCVEQVQPTVLQGDDDGRASPKSRESSSNLMDSQSSTGFKSGWSSGTQTPSQKGDDSDMSDKDEEEEAEAKKKEEEKKRKQVGLWPV
jgi:hypothetical protein